MPKDISNVHIEPLRSAEHKRRGFTCSVQKLQNFCQHNIHKQHDENRIRAFVACDGDSLEIIGYYTLNLSSLEIGKLDEVSDKKFERVEAIPVVYLGMIAVHDDYVRSGVGKMLMAHALHTTAEIANLAGMYALTLDALDETLVEYYKKFDFRPFKLGENGLEMFISLPTIKQAIAAAN